LIYIEIESLDKIEIDISLQVLFIIHEDFNDENENCKNKI
jgi:hypothetical protein